MAPPGVPPPFPAWRGALGVLTLTLLTATGLTFLAFWNSGWYVQVPRDFEPDGWSCRVRMPGPVDETVILPGDEFAGTLYATLRRSPDEGFGITARFDGGPTHDFTHQADEYLAEFIRAVLPDASPVPVTMPTPYFARQVAFPTDRHGNVVARVVHGGSMLYLQVCYGHAVTPDRPDVAAFFASFELTDEADRSLSAKLATAAATPDPTAGFTERRYGGPAPQDPTGGRGLKFHATFDDHDALVFGGKQAIIWAGSQPSFHGGVRGNAAYVTTAGESLTMPHMFSREQLFPDGPSTLAFWFRATPGDIPVVRFESEDETPGFVTLEGKLLRVLAPVPSAIPRKPIDIPRPSAGDWHHLALVERVQAGANRREVWLDGEKVATELVDRENRKPPDTTAMVFGGQIDREAGFDPLNRAAAAVDDLVFYERALTPKEIARLAAIPD